MTQFFETFVSSQRLLLYVLVYDILLYVLPADRMMFCSGDSITRGGFFDRPYRLIVCLSTTKWRLNELIQLAMICACGHQRDITSFFVRVFGMRDRILVYKGLEEATRVWMVGVTDTDRVDDRLVHRPVRPLGMNE